MFGARHLDAANYAITSNMAAACGNGGMFGACVRKQHEP
jgi:hypothetical protein